jgi:hypothetical protein
MRIRTKEFFIFEPFTNIDKERRERLLTGKAFSTVKAAQGYVDENYANYPSADQFVIAQGWTEVPSHSIYRIHK